jgi:hypothetical protein
MSVFSNARWEKNSENFRTMRTRPLRPVAVLLSVLLLANVPVQAAPIAISDVLLIISNYQNPPDLRLRTQTPTETPNPLPKVTSEIIDASVPVNDDSLLSGVVVETQNTQDPVNVAVPGVIQGTVCDCGEVMVAAAGWPKWPLLFLAAIPLFFIDGDDDGVTPTPTPTPTPVPTPTPTPPPAPVPEPGSLLLLGSGLVALGAGVRRRRLKARLKLQSERTEEG